MSLVYIENTRQVDYPSYHSIVDINARTVRTDCGKPVQWGQYNVMLPVEWTEQFATECVACKRDRGEEGEEFDQWRMRQ